MEQVAHELLLPIQTSTHVKPQVLLGNQAQHARQQTTDQVHTGAVPKHPLNAARVVTVVDLVVQVVATVQAQAATVNNHLIYSNSYRSLGLPEDLSFSSITISDYL